MTRNYADAVRQLYARHQDRPQAISEQMAVGAAVTVGRKFPPSDAATTLQVLAALNLLNAYVKQPDGSRLVTYTYIKGMAAQLLIYLLEHPVEGVEVYMDMDENVTYFRVFGIQISFHYLPLYKRLMGLLPKATHRPQQWEGLHLQMVAAELMQWFCPDYTTYAPIEAVAAREVMNHFRREAAGLPAPPMPAPQKKPLTAAQKYKQRQMQLRRDRWLPFHQPPRFTEDRWESLQAALTAQPWTQNRLMLYRRKDNCLTPFIFYDGTNYKAVMNYLIGCSRRIVRPSEDSMLPGRYYFLSRLKRVTWVSEYWKVLFLTQNNYLKDGLRYKNLCITYNIARYLALHFPSLRFACTLNFNRLQVRPRLYTLSALECVPAGSNARRLKVWLVVDHDNSLKGFDAALLPARLIDEYMSAEDYYAEYEIVSGANGRKGIYAYRHHHLLPPVYRDIQIRNYYAYVTGDNGRQAIYSLAQERFVSDFIYHEVYYDTRLGAIVGKIDGAEHIVYVFDLWPCKV